MDLLIVPIILFIIAQMFRGVESNKAEKREKIDREIEQDRQREAVLQTYLNQMKDLLLEKNLSKARPKDKVSVVARTLTLTTMRRLDGRRNETLLDFLRSAEIIDADHSVFNFAKANLSKIDLSEVTLAHFDALKGANFSHADLSKADLRGSNLSEANLEGANLEGALLGGCNLSRANLSRANLSVAFLGGGANLSEAILHEADLREASLNGANLRDTVLDEANLRKADLHMANLTGTSVRQADLGGSNLSGAYLITRASLSDANLSNATYDENTVWPEDFDPITAGAVFITAKQLLKIQLQTYQRIWLKNKDIKNQDFFAN